MGEVVTGLLLGQAVICLFPTLPVADTHHIAQEVEVTCQNVQEVEVTCPNFQEVEVTCLNVQEVGVTCPNVLEVGVTCLIVQAEVTHPCPSSPKVILAMVA